MAHFEKHHARYDVPCWVVFDLETYYRPGHDGDSYTASNSRVASFAYTALGLEGVCEPSAEHRYRVFYDRGDESNEVECVVRGLKSLLELLGDVAEKSKAYPKHNLTLFEEQHFLTCSTCYLCERSCTALVRDHCHFTGKYRGAACPQCNSSLKFRYIPCLSHNFGGYDGGPVQRAISRLKNPNQQEGDEYLKLRHKCINRTGEKLISIDLDKLKFQDSLNMLSGSLDSLIGDNREGKTSQTELEERFPILRERHPSRAHDLNLLLRKLPFPYSSLTDKACLAHGYPIPPRKKFYSELKDEEVHDDEWDALERVRESYKIRDFRDLHDLYLATDVLALADCLRNFRTCFRKIYDLDILHFLTLPKAAWNGALYRCQLKIELVTDWQLHLDVESGLRGGLCMPFQPHAEANDPATPEYNPDKRPAVIAYWDANSLYPSQMQKYLPIGDYELLQSEETTLEKLYMLIETLDPESRWGYYVVVNMYVPPHLHDQLDWGPIRKGPTRDGGPDKLYSYLGPQDEYCMTLQLACCYHKLLGVRFTKVHRIWRYRQEPHLREHVIDMAARRAAATSDIMKDTLKKCTNSYYGCTVENMQNRMSVVPYTSEFEFEQAVAKNWRPGQRVMVK